MRAKWSVIGVLGLVSASLLVAQEREDRTLLTQEQMTAIINEASGERAMHHVLELVPYQRVRQPEEYKGHFRESEVMAQFAKEYGFSNVAIESFADGQSLAADAWRVVDDDAEEREALRHPRHRAVARLAQRERRRRRAN